MGHRECDFCGVRSTVATATGIVEDEQVRDSHCTESRFGTHRFSEVPASKP